MKNPAIFLIRSYQKNISAHTPPRCRFTPTCSNYAIEAIEKFGTVRGTLLAAWRVARCNPFGGSGYDPVPDHFTFRSAQTPVSMTDEEAESLYDTEEDDTP